MDKYLDANDILSLVFLSLKDVDAVKECDINLFIVSLFETHRSKKRRSSLEVIIDIESNYDKDIFDKTCEGYIVKQKEKLLSAYKNLLDNDKSEFNEDIYDSILLFRKKYNDRLNKPKQKIR